VLSGSGVLDSVTGYGFGVIVPGEGADGGLSTLTIGEFTLQNASYRVTLLPGGCDQIQIKDSVDLFGGGLVVTPGEGLWVGEEFPIIDNLSNMPVSGTFRGLPEGSVISVGDDQFQITYQGGDGNDVVLTVLSVPEPSMGLAATLGAAGLLLRRRMSHPLAMFRRMSQN
jgi:hypothetical protein